MSELSAILGQEASCAAPSALATILHARGSSFRRPGARLWIGPGRREGSISAGCLENDLAERARTVIESGRAAVISYDTSTESDILWGTASGCGGRIDVLLEPFTPELREILTRAQSVLASRRCCSLAHLWQHGTIRRAIAEESGEWAGDDALTGAARLALERRRGSMEVVEPEGLALTELLLPPIALTVAGVGEDARRTAALAASLGWDVQLAHRSLAEREAGIPGVRSAATLEDYTADGRSALLIMSHDYYYDREILERALVSPSGYLGVVGPRRRTIDLLQSIDAPAEAIQRMHSPAGLDVGAETPAEIAISIVAEIQAVMAGHGGGRLTDRPGPIHRPAEAEVPQGSVDR